MVSFTPFILVINFFTQLLLIYDQIDPWYTVDLHKF